MNTENYHIGAGALSIGGVDVGGTTPNGMIVTYEPEIHLHKSGKYGNTPVKASLIGRNVTMEVEIAEATLANMRKVFAGANGNDSKVEFGGLAGVEIEGQEIILTPFDGTPAWVFRNAIPNSPVEMAYTVEDERVYKVTLTGMVDTAAPEDSNIAYVS